MYKKPPKIAETLLRIMLRKQDKEYILGDVEELFNDISEVRGTFWANIWYWYQVLISIFPLIYKSIYWGGTMFRNYFKITVRNLQRHKGFSIINLFGLATGIATCILIFLWVNEEVSYDTFHENSESLFRIESDYQSPNGIRHTTVSPTPLAPYLSENVPEVKMVSRCSRYGGINVKYGDQVFFENSILATDTTFSRCFPLI